jgi:RNA polymerase sigma-70 factor, ECF subfamily
MKQPEPLWSGRVSERQTAPLSSLVMIDATLHQGCRDDGLLAPPAAPEPARQPTVAATERVWSDSQVAAAPGKGLGLDVPGAASPAAERRLRLDDLFKEHATYVARLAFRLLGRDEEVDDIVQDVFITLFRNLDKIRQSESLRAWLGTTTVRTVRRRLRLRRIGFLLRRKDQVDPLEVEGSGASGEDRAALRNIHIALEKVSVNSRIAWVFRYIEQESIDDIARLCGCSRSTAKRRIADAHRVVRRALSDE